ncbi:MAG: multidrug effflux MFS transporter [Hyphomicrobiales bacterium]|nr:multidrug effflux MFS transporter [Hyphomicrobiales bacterium]
MQSQSVSREFVALMAILMSAVAVTIDAALPALGTIGRDLATTDPNDVQFIISFIFIGMAIGQLVSGPLSDAMGRKPLLAISLLLYLVGTVTCLLSTSLEVMLAGRLVQGIAIAGPRVSAVSMVRDRHEGADMARIMSLVMMIFVAVPIIAPALGQVILFAASWRAIFVFYLAYALAVAAYMAFRLPETLPPERRVPLKVGSIVAGAREVLTHRQAASYMLAFSCIYGGFIGFLSSCQQIYQVQYDKGAAFVFFFAVQAFGFGFASMANSKIVHRFGMRFLCHIGLAVMVGASAAMFVFSLLQPVPFALFFAYGVTLLFCFGLVFGNLQALAMQPMGHIAGMASAIIGAVSTMVAIPLATLIGQSYDGTLKPVVLGFGLLGTLAWLFMRLAERRARPA